MKLHELLAVETSLTNQANKCRSELGSTFEKKRHLFESKKSVFTPVEDGAAQQVEQQSDIQSTILKEIDWLKPFLVNSIDACYRISETNMTARADIELEDGTKVAQNVPATTLLELEKRLTEIQTLVTSIPTLDPAKSFTEDVQAGKGLYQARPITKVRTKKTKKVLIKYPADEHHPAQTELIDEDVKTGTIQEQEWSGLIAPAQKAEYINRVEQLTRAVRAARSRANNTDVDKTKKIGDQLLSYIFN